MEFLPLGIISSVYLCVVVSVVIWGSGSVMNWIFVVTHLLYFRFLFLMRWSYVVVFVGIKIYVFVGIYSMMCVLFVILVLRVN